MRKSFEVKIYSVAGAYLGTMPRSERVSDVWYTFQINGGQGSFDIELDQEWNSTEFSEGQFLRCYEYDDVHLNGVVIFTGQINRIERTYSAGIEKVKLVCLGLGALLAGLYFKSGGSYSFTKNQYAGQTVKDVVDYFNSVYAGGWLSYVPAEVENGSVANLQMQYTSCADAIKKCAEVVGFNWRIDPDGTTHFYENGGVNLFPSLQSDIQSASVTEDSENAVNRYILTWASGTVTVDDATSQSALGIREKFETDTSILDLPTATAKANSYLAKNKDAKRKIQITMNGNFQFENHAFWDDSRTWDDSEIWIDLDSVGTIEDIRPGHLVTVRNSLYWITALKIVRIDYNPEQVRIDLEDYDSFGKAITS